MIRVRLPDGSVQEHAGGEGLLEVARRWRREHGLPVVALRRDGEVLDLTAPLGDGVEVELLTPESEAGLEVLRHSTSHVLALAVGRLFEGVKFGIGPAISDGFYYDFEVPGGLREEDLSRIEEEMRRIVAEDLPFERMELPVEAAREEMARLGQSYKVELLERLQGTVTFYRLGEFVDLCRGPHVARTGDLAAFKLTRLAGSYWLGDSSRPMLQRVYGLAFAREEDLQEHLERLAEAERRDHRRLGRQLDLFNIYEEVGPGLVFWHPKGAFIRSQIERFWIDEHLKHGYELLYTPHIAKADIWARSGHLDFFSDYMYAPMDVDGTEYRIKPMNCPGHIFIYKSRSRSYRELPIRWAELGTVYRYERSGVLHGLLRVRGFTQDDAHLFCTPEQLEEEICGVVEFTRFILGSFGFHDYEVYLSTRPEKFVGTVENWERATEALRRALERSGLAYEVDPGEGVFYGPKIDIKIRDVLGRPWQCTTIQVDFNEPERFDVTYIGPDDRPHRPIMIHRALMGSLERFFGCLIEHYGGAFPMWLAPVQVVVIPVGEKQHGYARQVTERLRAAGLRPHLDDRPEKVGYKVREATVQKVPYMIIVGEREAQAGTVSLRARVAGDLGQTTVEEFIERAVEEVNSKALPEGMEVGGRR